MNLDDQFINLDPDHPDGYNGRESYVWNLAKLGYTPLIKHSSEELLVKTKKNGKDSSGKLVKWDEWNTFSEEKFKIDKDINMNAFVSANALNNGEIDECLDNDGDRDWPYDEECRDKSVWVNQ